MSTSEHQDLRKSHNKDASLHYLEKIRQGDVFLREEFISANNHFIINIISRSLDKPLVSESCPEFTVGLSAFNYSIDNYDLNSCEDFHIYSEKIIREWIFKYLKEEDSNSKLDSGEEDRYYLYRKYEDREEISLFKIRLWEFGITLRDLYFLSPGDEEPIKLSLKLAYIITGNETLFNKLISEKRLPIEDLHDKNKFQKKFIEKNMEYIIALCLIIKSNLKILQSYLKNIESGKGFTENTGIILEFFKKEAIVMNFQGQFIVIRIKNSSRNMGKQILLNNKNSQGYGSDIPWNLLVAGGSIVAVAVIIFISMYFIFNANGKNYPDNTLSYVTTSENRKSQTVNNKLTESDSNENTKANATEEVKEQVITPAQKEKPSSSAKTSPNVSNNHTSKPGKGTSWKYAQKVTEPTSIAPAAPPINTAKIEIKKATGVPGPVQISTASKSIKVEENISIKINMAGGNNGTELILLENGKFYYSWDLKDNTPDPQTKAFVIPNGPAGTFTYKCVLSNDFGSTESNSVTVEVTP